MKLIPYGLHWIEEEDVEEVIKVLKSNWITTGPKIEEFEKALCRYIGCKYAIAVNSGTSALDIAVASLQLQKNSEIITTPFSFIATSNVIIYNGHIPVFADIQRDTFNIDPSEIKKSITEKTKAIIYVDYAGHPCEIDEINEIAEENNLFLIEDACHALGAEYKGKKIGGFADITVFSFHPVKHITTGEGGVAVTNDPELAGRMRMLRNHGIDLDPRSRKDYRYDMKLLGRNYRITDFQAALGLSQLKKLESFLNKRRKIAKMYNKELEGIVEHQKVRNYVTHAWHIYPILVDNREYIYTEMRKRGIGVNVHYIPIYKHSYYINNFGYSSVDFPVTEEVYRKELTLPMYPRMTEDDINFVISSFKEVVLYEHKNRKS